MPELLVSIRNAEEAQTAKLGEVHWIDVKEPRNGPLGKAENAILNRIGEEVESSVPLSAALGEITGYHKELVNFYKIEKYNIVKFGTSNTSFAYAKKKLPDIARDSQKSPQSLVLAAYADFLRANSPPPDLFPTFCAEEGLQFLLIDTFEKDSTHLFSWLSLNALTHIRDRCEKLGIKLALAGRLGTDHLPALREIAPHIVGLRSAVCEGGIRDNPVSLERIRFWKNQLS